MANKNPICLQNETDLSRNELKNLQEMRSVKSRLIAADPNLMKPFPSCDREEVPSNFLR